VYADVEVDLSAAAAESEVLARTPGAGAFPPTNWRWSSARDAVGQRTAVAALLRRLQLRDLRARRQEGPRDRHPRLPARHDGKLYLLGGFHEFVTPIKGGKSKHFQQTNTCLELPLPKNGLGFMVSHVRSRRRRSSMSSPACPTNARSTSRPTVARGW
jgi:hypothetical protein